MTVHVAASSPPAQVPNGITPIKQLFHSLCQVGLQKDRINCVFAAFCLAGEPLQGSWACAWRPACHQSPSSHALPCLGGLPLPSGLAFHFIKK